MHDEDAGRSGIGEAARLREGSAGAAHGWAAIRFPWPWRVFGMRIALPSTGELLQVPWRKVGAQLRWSQGTCTAALRIAPIRAARLHAFAGQPPPPPHVGGSETSGPRIGGVPAPPSGTGTP